ncbi:sodium/potassium/calcium exchanger 1-like isoform X1 [Anguilla anguilla]|uniref:sodium/potassium/calcium exchanger 1-like isoform X1 n=1 Tax=Anguilla anguilla TaxID=7936 RepID=UPI0015AC5ECA|nr:sodium/potassium/calcium exchanger 1-like isoform X1 [Anguilla anguilla]XP_035273792.1 sodium/potassium/calcium exchanger 1-like isoform X1 [Anguilla anguilla]
MHFSQRKRLHWSRVALLLSGILLCCVYQLAVRAWPRTDWQTREDFGVEGVDALKMDRRELSDSSQTSPATAATVPPTSSTTAQLRHCVFVDPDAPVPTLAPAGHLTRNTTSATLAHNATLPSPSAAPHRRAEYPRDLFSVQQRQQGWVALHVFGMVYMFVSLAIVCDEFFVPALGVITDKLAISDDVAGATFMAAGGSAPELFTSLIGVFIAHSNVGIGTIVGSAVFNILFVIGMCALTSREMLHLTWWPLFRDVSFYTLALLMLIVFFLDNFIVWWESLLLVSAYLTYVGFMKYNVQLERACKSLFNRHKSIVKVIALEEPDKDSGSPGEANNPEETQQGNSRVKAKPSLQRGGSSASLHNSTMRNTIFQLMIHTLDPLGEETVFNGEVKTGSSVQGKVKFKHKAEILTKMAQGKVESRSPRGRAEDVSGSKTEHPNAVNVQTTPPPEPSTSRHPADREDSTDYVEGLKEQEAAGLGGSDVSGSSEEEDSDDDSEEEEEEEGENEEPLSLEWPDSRRKQATYLFLLPIVFPLWLTIPDVRNPASRRYFMGTFLGSILWIAMFSYLMVWWAHQVGETIGISEEIMGLTILAAGTSIPDLITSVIVARKGLGDMAVSSSVGSNIFDITIGLPVPWLLFSLFNGFVPVAISSNGLFCAIVLLFLMLLFVILSIAACKWKMNKALGFTMFLLYFLFLVLSVMLEKRIIVCPVTI